MGRSLRVLEPKLPEQRYSCQGCTNCCRGLVVHLTDDDVRRIEGGGWDLGAATHVRLGSSWTLNRRGDGACVFLDDDGRCRIHRRDGLDAKPLACRIFPFTMRRVGDGLRVGLRFDCPSVAQSIGAPLGAHSGDLHRWASEAFEVTPPATGRIDLRSDTPGSPRVIQHLIDTMERVLCGRPSDPTPFSVRLRCGAFVVSMLTRARFGDVDDDDFQTYLQLVVDSGAEAVEEMSVGPAHARTRRLLRQLVFAHVEATPHTLVDARGLSRVRLIFGHLQAGRRFAKGRGSVPRFGRRGVVPDEGSEAAAPTFAQVEAVRPACGDAAREAEAIVSRWIRARLLCGACYGGGYYGWHVIEGLGALTLGVIVASWRARWVAAVNGRDRLTGADVVDGVGYVDRVAGRAPSLRTRAEQLRVRYLMDEWRSQALLTSYPIVEEL